MKKTLVALAAGLVMSGTVAAEEAGSFAKIQYARFDVDRNFYNVVSEDTTPSALNAAYGYKFNRFVAVEGNLAIGWKDDKISNTITDFDLDKSLGVSILAYLPISDYFRLYGKFGYTRTQFEDGDGQDAKATGTVVGGGLEASFTDNVGMMVEYLSYPDGKYKGQEYKIETETVALGLFFRF